PRQVLPDQRGNRGAALRRDDPGVTVGFFVECNCDVFHGFCVTVKTGAVKAGRLLSPARRFGGAMPVLLGAIADDFTGATDLCNTLVRRGMRSVQLIDVPAAGAPLPDAEAVVVALKSRTTPASEAVAMSLDALAWLKRAGARQILFKYCSTFDSTALGNIGPVAEALLDALGGDFTLYCPAFPEAGRTIFKGYLFVGDVLLSESGMKDHPLTPM